MNINVIIHATFFLFVSPSFAPELLSILEEAQAKNSGPLFLWVRASRGVSLAGAPYPDEADLLSCLTFDFQSRLLNSVLAFGEPKSIAELRSRFARVMRDPKAHVLKVSRTQYGEMLKLIAQESDLDKRKRILKRAESKRADLVRALIAECESLDKELRMNLLSRNFLKAHPGVHLRTNLRPDNQLVQLRERYIQRIEEAAREATSILPELHLLDEKLLVIAECKKKLERLKERIGEDGDPASTPGPQSSPVLQSQVPAGSEQPKPRLHIDRKRNSVEQSVPKPPPLAPEKVHPLQSSLDRVRSAVSEGNRIGRLRVLIPNDGRLSPKLRREWAILLKELGFTGDLIFSNYQNLNNDEITPLIVPRKMNCHKNLWNPSRQRLMFIVDEALPIQLLRFHQGKTL